MKANKMLFLLIASALVLSSCDTEVTQTPSDEVMFDGIYTAAAMTSVAQSNQPIQSTATPLPTSTPKTISPTVTLIGILPTATLFQTILNTTSGVASCDNSAYLSDVTIPDNTIITSGESFTKTWSLQNIGTCAWTTSYSIAYYSGNLMSGSATALSDAVSSGGSLNVSVGLVAPSTAGTYTGYWRLQNANGVSFGEAVYVQIVVSGSTATPTATDVDESYTSTPTAEAISAIAPTTEPTSTPVPTTAPTNTPEPAATEAPTS
jgi:hypothetical protein